MFGKKKQKPEMLDTDEKLPEFPHPPKPKEPEKIEAKDPYDDYTVAGIEAQINALNKKLEEKKKEETQEQFNKDAEELGFGGVVAAVLSVQQNQHIIYNKLEDIEQAVLKIKIKRSKLKKK